MSILIQQQAERGQMAGQEPRPVRQRAEARRASEHRAERRKVRAQLRHWNLDLDDELAAADWLPDDLPTRTPGGQTHTPNKN